MSKRFGFWPHITHVIVLTFKEIKHLSDYRTIGPSDYRTVGLSDCRIIGRTPFLVRFVLLIFLVFCVEFLFVFVLCLVCPMFSMSLDCSFFVTPSGFLQRILQLSSPTRETLFPILCTTIRLGESAVTNQIYNLWAGRKWIHPRWMMSCPLHLRDNLQQPIMNNSLLGPVVSSPLKG